MGKIHFGVVADDFTGASDVASFLVKAGVPTVLFNGIPEGIPTLSGEIRAVVIALKTRTMAQDLAVSESPMRNHPLTPMRESSLVKLVEMQSAYPARLVGKEGLAEAERTAMKTPCYLIPDYENDEDGNRIAEQYGELAFLTGGSGLIGALGRRYVRLQKENAAGSADKALVLAGSCSAMTLKQIADYTGRGAASYRLRPDALLDGSQNVASVFAWIREQESGCLVFSSAAPEDLEKSQKLGKEDFFSRAMEMTAKR